MSCTNVYQKIAPGQYCYAVDMPAVKPLKYLRPQLYILVHKITHSAPIVGPLPE